MSAVKQEAGPKRIQRKRTAGWRMPENAVSVTRPGKWGNHYKMGARYPYVFDPTKTFVVTAENCLELFEIYAEGMLAADPEWLKPLRGKNPACWCALCPAHADGKPLNVECSDCSPCHADILLRLANAPDATKENA